MVESIENPADQGCAHFELVTRVGFLITTGQPVEHLVGDSRKCTFVSEHGVRCPLSAIIKPNFSVERFVPEDAPDTASSVCLVLLADIEDTIDLFEKWDLEDTEFPEVDEAITRILEREPPEPEE